MFLEYYFSWAKSTSSNGINRQVLTNGPDIKTLIITYLQVRNLRTTNLKMIIRN